MRAIPIVEEEDRRALLVRICPALRRYVHEVTREITRPFQVLTSLDEIAALYNYSLNDPDPTSWEQLERALDDRTFHELLVVSPSQVEGTVDFWNRPSDNGAILAILPGRAENKPSSRRFSDG